MKRILSLVLVLTMIATLFTGVAFAAGGAVTFSATAKTLSFTPGESVNGKVIGQIYVNSSPITADNFKDLNGKITAASNVADGSIAVSLDNSGNVALTFLAKETAVKDAAISLKINVSGYTPTTDIDTGIKASVAIPVDSITVAQYASGKFAGVSGNLEIEATTKSTYTEADKNYFLFAVAKPATALAADLVLSAKSSDTKIVKVSAPAAITAVTPTGDFTAAHAKQFILEGVKPGDATITISAGGYNAKVNVTVKETAMTGYDVEYKLGATLAGSSKAAPTGIAPGLVVDPAIVDVAPTYATNKKVTYNVTAQTPDGIATGDVISIDNATGKVTTLQAGTAEILVTPVDNSGKAGTRVVNFKVTGTRPTTISAPVISLVADTTDDGDGTSATPHNVPRKFEIATSTANCSIYYTVDGTTPSKTNGTLYTEAFELSAQPKDKNNAACGIKAIAIYDGTDVNLPDSTVTELAAANLNFALKATKVTLDKGEALPVTGTEEIALVATLTPDITTIAAANKVLTWTSSDATVIDISTATISADTLTLKVKALKKGKATLTATAPFGAYASCEVTVADSKITALAVEPTSATLPINESLQLKAIVTPETAFDAATLTWSSSAPSIVAVNGTGKVTAVANSGSANITVWNADKSISATCVVTLAESSTVVAMPEFTVTNGSTIVSGTTFEETGYVVTATTATTGANVNITGTKDGVAITGGTSVTLSDNGTYVLTATATDPSNKLASSTATETYVVSVPVKKVVITSADPKFNATEKTLKFDGIGNALLGWTLDPTNADVDDPAVTWTSSDPAVVAIYDKDTKVEDVTYTAHTAYALKDGEATITATTTGKAAPVTSDPIKVTVAKKLVTSITVPNATIYAGETTQLTATVLPANATEKTLSWKITSQTPEGVATIDETTGKITGVAAGSCTVVATATDGSMISSTAATITVNAARAAQAPTFKIDGAAATGSYTITVAGKATIETLTNGAEIYYTTNATTPSATNGTLYAGEFELPADCNTLKAVAIKDGKASAASTLSLTWDVKPTKITLTPSKDTLAQGEEFTVTVAFEPANTAQTYKTLSTSDWTASQFTVGTYDVKTGVAKFTVKPNATLGLNTIEVTKATIKGKCQVTVTKKTITDIEIIAANEGALSVGATNQLTAVITPEGAAPSGVIWQSSDTKIATVDATGLVTAKAVGEATITAIAKDDSTKSATYVVKVEEPTTPPAPLTIRPVLTPAASKTVEVLQNGSAKIEIAHFDEKDVAAIKYYFTPEFKVSTIAGFEGTYTISMDDAGVVYLNIKNATKAGNFSFNFDWKLTPIAGRGGIATWGNVNVSGYTLKVVGAPTIIAFSPETVADVKMTTAETKEIVLGKISNYADFTKVGTKVTATATVGTVAIAADGTVTLTLSKLEAGEYSPVVTISAPGCTDVKTTAFKVTVEEAPAPGELEIKNAYQDAKGIWHAAVGVELTFPEKAVLVKAKQAKYLEIAADGLTAKTLKKGKVNLTVGSKAVTLKIEKKVLADPANVKLMLDGKDVEEFTEPYVIAKSAKLQLMDPANPKAMVVVKSAKFEDVTGLTLKAPKAAAKITIKAGKKTGTGTATLVVEAQGEEFTFDFKIGATGEGIEVKAPVEEAEEVIEEIEGQLAPIGDGEEIAAIEAE